MKKLLLGLALLNTISSFANVIVHTSQPLQIYIQELDITLSSNTKCIESGDEASVCLPIERSKGKILEVEVIEAPFPDIKINMKNNNAIYFYSPSFKSEVRSFHSLFKEMLQNKQVRIKVKFEGILIQH